MVRVETFAGFTRNDADKLMLEFLSALAWSEQGGVVPTFGNWCTAPLAVGKGPSGCIFDGTFDYLPDPSDPKAKLALALYREGLSVNLVPYKVLGFFKVINIICDKGSAQKQWIRDSLQYVADKDAIARIATIQSTDPDVAKYLYESGRCAVAHAFDQNTVVNPDEPADLIRLRKDLPVIRELARIALEREFGVLSERDFHRKHLYELEGFRALFGDALVARIMAAEEVPAADVPIPKTMALRVRGRDRIGLFESMDAAVVYVRDGCVRLRLGSACHRLIVFVALDFARESLVSDPLTDTEYHDDGTPDAAKMMLQFAQMYRWWFGSNGVIELWDKATDVRLARAQPYMPPMNSRFPHDDFEKMERELRARAGISDPPADSAD
ncbi:MAG: methylamine utilization protein MauJ [Thermoguttaceae bacterium]|jgi:hypothetical protein